MCFLVDVFPSVRRSTSADGRLPTTLGAAYKIHSAYETSLRSAIQFRIAINQLSKSNPQVFAVEQVMPPTSLYFYAPIATSASSSSAHLSSSSSEAFDRPIAWLVAGTLFALAFCAASIASWWYYGRVRALKDIEARRKRLKTISAASCSVVHLQPPRSFTTTGEKITTGLLNEKAVRHLPPPAAHTGQRSLKSRETVFCKAMGQLPRPNAGKITVSVFRPFPVAEIVLSFCLALPPEVLEVGQDS